MRKTLWTASVNLKKKFLVLVAYICIIAQNLPKKTWVFEQDIYAFPLLETTCKISFLLPGIEEELLLYGCTGYVVVSAVRFGNHSEEQTGTKFFWGLFTFEHNTLLVLPRSSFTWNYRYPLQNFKGLFFHYVHLEKPCVWLPLVYGNNFTTLHNFSLWHKKHN
jgi:hypothetical protein